jgi:hypothetical protein
MQPDRLPRLDWDAIPRHASRAHALRSAELRRLLGSLIAGFVRLARRPFRRRPAGRLHPAGC